jgi:hypothetical protein
MGKLRPGKDAVRQGDVSLVYRGPAKNVVVPEGAKIIKSRILRKGENGGIHTLDKKQKDITFYEDENGSRFVISPKGVDIVHLNSGDPHKDVAVPAGHWEVVPQKEETSRGERYVLD